MYESSNSSYISIKFIPLIIGILLVFIALLIIIDSTFKINIKCAEPNTELIFSYFLLSYGTLTIVFFSTIGRRIVKMRIDEKEFEFTMKGEIITKNWNEVKSLKKYWFFYPALYSVRFENVKKPYYFTTIFWCIGLPFYVIDISEMGSFLEKKKENIKLLKKRNKEKNYATQQ